MTFDFRQRSNFVCWLPCQSHYKHSWKENYTKIESNMTEGKLLSRSCLGMFTRNRVALYKNRICTQFHSRLSRKLGKGLTWDVNRRSGWRSRFTWFSRPKRWTFMRSAALDMCARRKNRCAVSYIYNYFRKELGSLSYIANKDIRDTYRPWGDRSHLYHTVTESSWRNTGVK